MKNPAPWEHRGPRRTIDEASVYAVRRAMIAFGLTITRCQKDRHSLRLMRMAATFWPSALTETVPLCIIKLTGSLRSRSVGKIHRTAEFGDLLYFFDRALVQRLG